jgi:NADH:ubiquinone oxidoreductase subunit F (NADH-binding)/NADH:ubiquinone oxidoreductase subunit E
MKARPTPKGRTVDPRALDEVRALLGAAPRRRDLLIEHLHALQDRYGHLSAVHLAALAAEMRLSLAEVYEVATFYHHFDVVREADAAPPALTVRVCDSIACEMAGARELLQTLPALLGRDVRVVAAPCVGRCDAAPVSVVGQNPIARASPARVREAVARGATRCPAPRPVSYARYVREGGYRLIAECLAGRRTRDEITRIVEASGLRGLGGAGFPVGRKWRIVAAEAEPRLMALNLDEGEPGTFKDRHFLERDPHRFLEGMLVAAWCAGVGEIYIYLRDEYAGCRTMLIRELGRLRRHAPCALPPIHLRRGAGAYICGEESAMIESIEGKRGLPRLRPPYVAQLGLFGRPTLEHNMESVYWVREIVEKGATWFAAHGRRGRKGLRAFSVSGRVKAPGVHVAPAGISVRELIDEYCGGMQDGHAFYAYLPGGASGGILPAALGDLALDFDTLQPHGCFIGSAAIVVLSQRDTAAAAARNLMTFFRNESCGQCTPCRVGTAKALELMRAGTWNRPLLEALSQAMLDASICGLGQAAPNPALSVMKYFAHEVS